MMAPGQRSGDTASQRDGEVEHSARCFAVGKDFRGDREANRQRVEGVSLCARGGRDVEYDVCEREREDELADEDLPIRPEDSRRGRPYEGSDEQRGEGS